MTADMDGSGDTRFQCGCRACGHKWIADDEAETKVCPQCASEEVACNREAK